MDDATSLKDMSLDEVKALEEHLDDESEWQNANEFYEAWSPRLNDRLRRLISTCRRLIEERK